MRVVLVGPPARRQRLREQLPIGLDVVAKALTRLGFACHRLRFEEPGTAPVDNLYARLGDKDKAFEWLERARVQRDGGITLLKIDPIGTPVLRDDPLLCRAAEKSGDEPVE